MAGENELRRSWSCPSKCRYFWQALRAHLLLVLIISGCVTGFIVGAAVNGPVNRIKDPAERKTVIMLIGFPGELLMNMLKLVVLPMLVASIICAVSSLDVKTAGRVGRRTIIYYMSTTILACILGVILVSIIKPGKVDKQTVKEEKTIARYRTLDGILDLIRSLFPRNIVEAATSSVRTKYTSIPAVYSVQNQTLDQHKPFENGSVPVIFFNGTHNLTTVVTLISQANSLVPAGTKIIPGTNVLGLIVFCIVFGAVLGRMDERGTPLKDFFMCLNEVVMAMVHIVNWLAPVGICSLIAARLADMGNVVEVLTMLGKFIGTVLTGLSIHSFLVIPLIFYAVSRRNPYKYMYRMTDAMVYLFGVDSSLAVLPTTIRCVEDNNHVDPRISRFVLPLGATINMDGTAFYEGVSAVFIAQMNGIDLSVGQLITTVITGTAAAIGAPALPHAGLVTMVMVLQAVGLPIEDIGLIYAVDWFLDRCRGMCNLMGDAMGAGIVYHLSRDDLLHMNYNDEETEGVHHRDTYVHIGDNPREESAKMFHDTAENKHLQETGL